MSAFNIPFMRLDRQYDLHKEEILARCDSVFGHGGVLQGAEVTRLEDKLCELLNTSYAVAVGSGTDALFFALGAAGVQAGDRVAVPTMTFIATVSSIVRAGAIPVFVDAGADYQPNMEQTLELVEQKRVEAVIVTPLFGQLYDIRDLSQRCKQQGVILVEDAAQALGATLNGHSCGHYSTAASISFDPMKTIGAYGSGGAVITNDPVVAETIRALRYHGLSGVKGAPIVGYNSQLGSVQAAIIAFKLTLMDTWIRRRQVIAGRYSEALKPFSNVTSPIELQDGVHTFHKYVLSCGEQRDGFQRHLKQAGIETKVHYANLLHENPLFANDSVFSLSVSKRLSQQSLSLPIYPELFDEEVEYICDVMKSYWQ